MSDSHSDDIHDVKGTTALEHALVTVELELDGIFEAAERSQSTAEEGAGLVLEKLLDLIYENFATQIPYDRIGLAMLEDNGTVMRSRWVRSEAESLTMGSGDTAPLGDSVIQDILSASEPLIVNDLEEYLQEHANSEPTRRMVDEGMRSSLTCPLATAGKPLGLMVFSSKQANAYNDGHKEMFGHIATHVAVILDRSRLYERLGELNWQLRVARDAMEYQATHDGLTRLLNRGAILKAAEREMDRARRQERPITIVMCDIDRFKLVNDAHGHMVGDVVLQQVADRLKQALRSYETVGRYGGEEFLITLYDCGADDAPHALERLRAAVDSEGIETDAGSIHVTISLGGAVSNGNTSVEAFIKAADEAMYEAKEAGRNRHAVRLLEAAEA